MEKSKKNQRGIFPLTTIATNKWWEKSNASDALTKGGSVATQQQCSCNGNGGGGGSGTCGTRGK